MIVARGRVFLGGNQFTADPSIERQWTPRQSVLMGIGGTSTVQDFGRRAKDLYLTLSSASPAGSANWMSAALKKAIDAMFFVRGAVFSYSDYTGLEASAVKIIDFTPKPTFLKDEKFVLYEYTLRLKVVTITKLDGAVYGGL